MALIVSIDPRNKEKKKKPTKKNNISSLTES